MYGGKRYCGFVGLCNKSANMNCSGVPLGRGLISTGGAESTLSVPRLLVNLTGGAGGFSSSLDMLPLQEPRS